MDDFRADKIKLRTFVLTCEEMDSGLRKRTFCTNRLSKYEFVQGMSKYNVDDSIGIMNNPFDYGFGNRLWEDSAVAICYGHYAIWEKVVQVNETCLVLEDDVQVLPNIACLNDYIENENLYDNLSVLSLWKTGVHEHENYNQFYKKLVSSYGNSGALGYVLNPATANFLITQFEFIQEPVDHYILGAGSLKDSDYTAYVTKKDVVMHADGISLRKMEK